MEGSFSVATNNRFAFFMNEEDDPGDILAEESKPKVKELAVQPKDDKSPKNKKRIVKEKGQPEPNRKTDSTGKRKETTSFCKFGLCVTWYGCLLLIMATKSL